MFEDNFEEDFMEDSNSPEMKAAYQAIYDKLVDKIVRANYEAIEEQGIDVMTMRVKMLDNNALTQLKDTLAFMIQYFIDTEEYEKCATLNKYMEELNS